jgi:hypothetical protein
MSSLPNLYRGSATYYPTQKFNYIVLSKWNEGGDPVAFKKLSVTKLPVSPTDVAGIDKHFITTPFSSPDFINDLWSIENDSSTKLTTVINGEVEKWNPITRRDDIKIKDPRTHYDPGTDNRATFIWLAGLYRIKDYYFGTNSKNEVQYLYGRYLSAPSMCGSTYNTNKTCDLSYITNEFAKYAGTDTSTYGENYFHCGYHDTQGDAEECPVGLVHSLINNRQSEPFMTYLVADYLSQAQKDAVRPIYAKIINEAVRRMKTDGVYPRGTKTDPKSLLTTNYQWDTYAEETGWMTDFLTGYYLAFPYDYELTQVPNQAAGVKKPRAELLVDYINFLGFHTLSNNPLESIQSAYGGAVHFKHLDSSFAAFKSQYLYSDGTIDNHGFHPSINYAYGIYGSIAIARNLLIKNGINLQTLNHNLDLAFTANTYNKMDIKALRHKVPNTQIFGLLQSDLKPTNIPPERVIINPEDWYEDPYPTDLLSKGFMGQTNPSLLEDHGNTYTGYHVGVNYGGNLPYALSWAQSVYYLYHNGIPGMIRGAWPRMLLPNKVNAPFSPYTQAIYSTLFSQQQALGKLKPGDMNRDGVVNGSDMNLVIGRYGSNVQDMVEDIDDNGVFNAVDMRAFHE